MGGKWITHTRSHLVIDHGIACLSLRLAKTTFNKGTKRVALTLPCHIGDVFGRRVGNEPVRDTVTPLTGVASRRRPSAGRLGPSGKAECSLAR